MSGVYTVKGLTIRNAHPADRHAVFEFCKGTWGQYGDYIARVWHKWIRDPHGLFITAELNGIPVGIAKITDFGDGEIWLEGLRVDPKHRGKGIANRINLEVLRTLKRMRPRKVRFCTATVNRASRHIGAKFGFKVAARFRYYWMRSRRGKAIGELARRGDTGLVYDYIVKSRFIKLSSGLIAEGWVFRELKRGLVERFVRKRRVMILRKYGAIRGVAIYPYEEADKTLNLGFIDGDRGAIKALARNCLYLAKSQASDFCSAAVPTRYYVRLVEEAGFNRKESLGQIVVEYDRTDSQIRQAGRT